MTTDLFGFLTTEPNARGQCRAPEGHSGASTTREECDAWISMLTANALALQRPLPDGALIVVARGEKQDPPASRMEKGLLL